MELCINMRVFKALLLANALLAMAAEANPLLQYSRERDSKPSYYGPEADSKKELLTDHYDQRQNGTENYRVKVDGLVFILAPADSLLLAGAALEPNFTSLLTESGKPKPKLEKTEPVKLKDDEDDALKSNQQDHAHAPHKPVLRITNLIAPFLNRITSLARHDKFNQPKNTDTSST